MSTPTNGKPRTFACLVSPSLGEHEATALLRGGAEPSDFATVTIGIAQMNAGLATDPTTGQTVWLVQAVAPLEGEALTVKQSAILDASGAATSAALAKAMPIGGTVRLVVRRDALHPDLRAKLDAPRVNLAAFGTDPE